MTNLKLVSNSSVFMASENDSEGLEGVIKSQISRNDDGLNQNEFGVNNHYLGKYKLPKNYSTKVISQQLSIYGSCCQFYD